MGAVAAPRHGRPAGSVSLWVAAVVAASAAAILLFSPGVTGSRTPTAAPVDPNGRVTFDGLGTTYLAASPPGGNRFVAFTDIVNMGDHPVTITAASFPANGTIQLDDIAIKRISHSGATFGPPLVERSPQPFALRLAPRQSLQLDYHFRAPGCRPGGGPRHMLGGNQPLEVGYRAGDRSFTFVVPGSYVPTC